MELNARLNELLFIDTMTADGQVLTIQTTKPVPSFLSNLCEPVTGILDVSAETDPAVQPIGTGPYMAKSYEVKKQCVVGAIRQLLGWQTGIGRRHFQHYR